MNENIFREAREIARHCTMPPYRDNCRERCDTCKEIFDRFNLSASREDFRELVAAWSRLLLAMDACGPYVGPPTQTGGKMPVAVAVGR